MYLVRLTATAERDLGTFDKTVAKRILKKLSWFGVQANPLQFAKRLVGITNGKYRFRIGDYRAFFDISERGEVTILFILHVRHRREAYEK